MEWEKSQAKEQNLSSMKEPLNNRNQGTDRCFTLITNEGKFERGRDLVRRL